jgi:hypothetical protein
MFQVSSAPRRMLGGITDQSEHPIAAQLLSVEVYSASPCAM